MKFPPLISMRRRSSLDAVWPLVIRSIQSSLCRRVAVPVERLVMGSNHHALGIEVVIKTFGAEFASDTGVIDAAPGRGRVKAVVIVDPDDAGLDGGGHAMRAPHIAGADRC